MHVHTWRGTPRLASSKHSIDPFPAATVYTADSFTLRYAYVIVSSLSNAGSADNLWPLEIRQAILKACELIFHCTLKAFS
mmetsp:Transcript_4781/g.8140  ORF Transcript_4781/g.8140 Transcript_4781/m.8140 type:complete len:80 (+) Transcript_4781:2-241(+)